MTTFAIPNILRWRIILAITLLIPLLAFLTLVLLAAGAADPAYAGPLQWETATVSGWERQHLADNLLLDHAPYQLPMVFSLEATATDSGPDNSAWGLMLGDEKIWVLVSREGYYSVQKQAQPKWVEFPHIRLNAANSIRLDYDAEQNLTLRINGEYVWSRVVPDIGQKWALLSYRQPSLNLDQLRLYAPLS